MKNFMRRLGMAWSVLTHRDVLAIWQDPGATFTIGVSGWWSPSDFCVSAKLLMEIPGEHMDTETMAKAQAFSDAMMRFAQGGQDDPH